MADNKKKKKTEPEVYEENAKKTLSEMNLREMGESLQKPKPAEELQEELQAHTRKLTLCFTPAQFKKVQKTSNKIGMQMGPFIRWLVMNYIEKGEL